MRLLLPCALVVSLASASWAAPLDREVADLVAGCRTPLSMNMPNVRLGKFFDTLESLTAECAVEFELAPYIASREATVKLRDAPLATVLDVLARTNGLVYSARDGRIVVSGTPVEKTDEARTKVWLDFEIETRALSRRGFATKRGRLGVAVADCGDMVATFGDVGTLFLLQREAGRLQESTGPERGVRVRLCPNVAPDGGLEIAGEVTMREVVDGGYGSHDERRLFQRSVAPGEKDVRLVTLPASGVSLILSRYEVKVRKE